MSWQGHHAMTSVESRIREAVLAVSALAQAREIVFSTDERTDAACRAYLKNAINEQALREKVTQELGPHDWRPLGRLLLIISENDVLGTALAFLGAFITGNQVLIKARTSLDILHFLKKQLRLDDDAVQIADWQGGMQDDEALLEQVDGVVLAGGADLITHFRRVSPPRVRLIEFGPKISAAAIGSHVKLSEIPRLATLLVDEVCLFLQQVCSAPRFILVESDEHAKALYAELCRFLSTLPRLPDDIRLAQAAKFAELQLMKKINGQIDASLMEIVFEPSNGWGITLCQGMNAALWFEKGFQLVVGSVDASLSSIARQWRGSLQTLGMAGCDDVRLQGFTRFCPLGAMHQRPLTAPHDGFFEFSSLVVFISKELA